MPPKSPTEKDLTHHGTIKKGIRTGNLGYLFEVTEKVGDFQDCTKRQY